MRMNAPFGRDRQCGMAVDGAQLRISGKRCLRVTGHVDFRNDLDMPGCREGDNLAHLLLGVEAPVRFSRSAARRRGGNSPRSNRGELWVLADLQPPALIIG